MCQTTTRGALDTFFFLVLGLADGKTLSDTHATLLHTSATTLNKEFGGAVPIRIILFMVSVLANLSYFESLGAPFCTK